MAFIGYYCIGLFITIHMLLVKSLRKWMLKPHPDYPKDFRLPAWVHVAIAIPSAAVAFFAMYIVLHL